MTIDFHTYVNHLTATPLGLLPERWKVEHRCAHHSDQRLGNFSDRVWGVFGDRYHLGHVADIGPAFEHECRHGVTKEVTTPSFLNASLSDVMPH